MMRNITARIFIVLLLLVLVAGIVLRLNNNTRPVVHAAPVRGTAGDNWADIIIGKQDFSDITPYSTTATRLFLAHAVTIDRNNPSDNKMYVFDGGNNRILGFDLEDCRASVTEPLDCVPSIVIGQPDFNSSACNGDNAYQNFPTKAQATASTLCVLTPDVLSVSESVSGPSMDVDSDGNLWVVDYSNNRVLKYNTPFTSDSIADDVWGQDNFTDIDCNSGEAGVNASGFCFDWGTSNNWGAGIDIDSSGNLWVVDTGNNRVLRFLNNSGTVSKTASLVLGQTLFTTSTAGSGLSSLEDPSAVRVNAAGEVYVADHKNNRILKYATPSNGVAGVVFGSGFSAPAGIDLDDTEPGRIWIADTGNCTLELWDETSETLIKTVGVEDNGNLLGDASGSVGVDSAGNLYVGTTTGESKNSVIIFDKSEDPTVLTHRLFTPSGVGNYPDEKNISTAVGIAVTDDQLMVADHGRILFWNKPNGISDLTNGKSADGYVVSTSFNNLDGGCCTVLKTDNVGHLYTIMSTSGDDLYRVAVYDLPLVTGASPIKEIGLPIPLLGGGEIALVDPFSGFSGILPAPDASYLWIAERNYNRVFRVRDPLGVSPVIDVILGQVNSTDTDCNQGGSMTDSTLCAPGSLSFDRFGNFFLTDHWLEITGNTRILIYDAGTFPTDNESIIYATPADRIIPDVAAWEASFDAFNKMVIGFNPYYGGADPEVAPNGGRFPAIYNSPLAVDTVPDEHLNDYYSMAFSSAFDNDNNLYVGDLNRGRVMIYEQPVGSPNIIMTEVTPVVNNQTDTTPNYTFNSSYAGTISYGGSCSAADTTADAGNNTITFNALTPGTYTDCTITVTDSALGVTGLLNVSDFTIKPIPPVVTQVTPVTTPTTDRTPNYTFNTTKAGTISYGGSCSSTVTVASVGNNTITFSQLSIGTHSDCTITVTEGASNVSNVLTVSTFVVQTTGTGSDGNENTDNDTSGDGDDDDEETPDSLPVDDDDDDGRPIMPPDKDITSGDVGTGSKVQSDDGSIFDIFKSMWFWLILVIIAIALYVGWKTTKRDQSIEQTTGV